MRASKMTSQRTRSWSVAQSQLAKGDFGVCERYTFFLRCCTKGAFTKVYFEAREVFFKQVGIRGNYD